MNLQDITVCVVPRAKVNYESNQLLFKATVKKVIPSLEGFYDGISFISRKKDTRTTHRDRAGYGGNGKLPYVGITIDTCNVSNSDIKDKDILLIDDIYTPSICIDEDVVQALFDNGAKSVIFYAVGKTI